MKFLVSMCALLFSSLAVVIMSYISMATPIGPWIETTIALLGIITFYPISKNSSLFVTSVGLTTFAAGIGGILATGFGFSFPALYFTDPALFQSWVTHPSYFYFICAGLALAAGSFGFALADLLEEKLIFQQKLAFPIGELLYKTVFAENRLRQALELFIGFSSIQVLFLMNRFFSFMKPTVVLFEKMKIAFLSLPEIIFTLDQLPLYLSIGFVTGHVIAIPLIAGFLVKTLCIEPLFYVYSQPSGLFHSLFFPFGLARQSINSFEFTLAFGSGIVLYGTFITFFDLKKIKKSFKSIIRFTHASADFSLFNFSTFLKIVLPLAINIAFLTYFQFSILAQLFILVGTAFCIYQMLIIAGQIGIVPLGRFATFIMVPGIMLFGLSSVQAILVATFVEVAGGVAADVLFGRKFAQQAAISRNQMMGYQLLGLITACLTVGAVFWLFAYTFSFDACGLPVTKAASRALLINSKNFDTYILFLGFVSGFLLKFTRINSALLLGGILMPPSVSLMLIAGGVLSFVVKNKEAYYPFFSGISAGSIVWILIQAIFVMIKRVC